MSAKNVLWGKYMNESNRYKNNIALSVIIVAALFLSSFIVPDKEISKTERRKLAQMPKLDENYMDNFEKYWADQFPLRESFRTIHANFSKNILRRKELNQIYSTKLKDGSIYLSKLDYDIDQESIQFALKRFEFIHNKYLSDCNTYYTLIPDKSYYLQSEGFPYLDLEEMENMLELKMGRYASKIDIKNKMTIYNYYKTDTHWKQESLIDISKYLLKQMGREYDINLTEKKLMDGFKGVYYGQAALDVPKDTIKYMAGGYIENLNVKCYDSGKGETDLLYNLEKSKGLDAYEFFLGGSKALMTIENPEAESDKELIIFRDSFASSLAPLLASGYSKITLIDIRYINPAILGKFVNFKGADVLFLYSAQLLNNNIGQFL